jgi:hypothetical protein
MRTEQVEIYSDETNLAVMRHPGRKFPGVLVQGDTLHVLCTRLDELCAAARAQLTEGEYAELNELRNGLHAKLSHYKAVLGEHGIPLPF